MKHLFSRVKEGFSHLKSVQFIASSVMMAMLPVQLISLDAVPTHAPQPWQTQLVLAEASPELLVKTEPSIEIKKTTSRYEEEQAKSSARRKQASPVHAMADVSMEQKEALAAKVAEQYGVPKQLILAVWQIESGMRWYYCSGSSAGARGPAQFMPGTFRKYGVDGNGDGAKDICHAEDSIPAAARLLAANGASQGDYDRALFAYNHADWYVKKVRKQAGL